MSLHYDVDQVRNGYIITDRYGIKRVYESLDDVFRDLLFCFEQRAPLYALHYGEVHIVREHNVEDIATQAT